MFCMTREYEKFYQIRSIPFFRHDFSRKGTLNPSNFFEGRFLCHQEHTNGFFCIIFFLSRMP